MVARAILYHPVLQYVSHLFFYFMNILKQNLLNLEESYGNIKAVYIEDHMNFGY